MTDTLSPPETCLHDANKSSYIVADLDTPKGKALMFSSGWRPTTTAFGHWMLPATLLASCATVTDDGLRYAETWKCPECRMVLHLFETR